MQEVDFYHTPRRQGQAAMQQSMWLEILKTMGTVIFPADLV